ncbi:MAG: hypothetical protein CM15mP71_5240 [Candidatus Poseidoniales archaeon]|nr:MAG: hypothetical protein CM15mP71_5240 [Candidatus Poseidoniales archaeon]
MKPFLGPIYTRNGLETLVFDSIFRIQHAYRFYVCNRPYSSALVSSVCTVTEIVLEAFIIVQIKSNFQLLPVDIQQKTSQPYRIEPNGLLHLGAHCLWAPYCRSAHYPICVGGLCGGCLVSQGYPFSSCKGTIHVDGSKDGTSPLMVRSKPFPLCPNPLGMVTVNYMFPEVGRERVVSDTLSTSIVVTFVPHPRTAYTKNSVRESPGKETPWKDPPFP